MTAARRQQVAMAGIAKLHEFVDQGIPVCFLLLYHRVLNEGFDCGFTGAVQHPLHGSDRIYNKFGRLVLGIQVG